MKQQPPRPSPEAICWMVQNSNLPTVFAARGRDADWRVARDVVNFVRFGVGYSAATEDHDASCDVTTSAAPSTSAAQELEVHGDEGLLLGVRTAATEIGISPSAARRAIAEHRLPAQLIGAVYAIRQSDVHQYARSRRRRTA